MIPAELHESNVFELQQLRAKLKLAEALCVDTYNQTRESLRLLGECRSLLETALESPLRKDILDLIARIDAFKGD